VQVAQSHPPLPLHAECVLQFRATYYTLIATSDRPPPRPATTSTGLERGSGHRPKRAGRDGGHARVAARRQFLIKIR
jgi:hypothetical protein